MNSKLKEILNFTKFTQKFRGVDRAVIYNNKHENDMEHSYQLAMLAWYIIDSHHLNLDVNEVLKFSLVHDLVEAYTGDISVFDDEAWNNKKEKEEEAIEKFSKDFPEFKNLHIYIEKYEARNEMEAKFVYTLDKLIPVLNIYLDDGKSWQKQGVTFKNFLSHKKDRFENHQQIKKYFEEMLEILEEKQQDLFHQDN